MSQSPRPSRAAAAASLRQVLAMLRPPNMAAVRRFMLRHDAETDLGVLSDVGRMRHASLLSGESVVLNAPSGTALDTLLVPFVSLGLYTVGIIVISAAGFVCTPWAGVDEAGVEQTLVAPMVGKCLAARGFSAGRYLRAEDTGEILYVLSDLRGGRVETVSLIWVGPPFGPESRARETVALSCDAAPFAAGRLVDSVATYSHTVRWQRGAAPAPMRLPQHPLDFSANATNMAEYAGSTDVYLVSDMAVVGTDGRLVSERRSVAEGDPRGRGRRLLTSFVDSLAHWPTHVLRASLMNVAVQTRVGQQSPLRWGVSAIVDTYTRALEHATQKVSALRLGATTDEDELFEHTEHAVIALDGMQFDVGGTNIARSSCIVGPERENEWVSTIPHRLAGLVKNYPSVGYPVQVGDIMKEISSRGGQGDTSSLTTRAGHDSGGIREYGSISGGDGGGSGVDGGGVDRDSVDKLMFGEAMSSENRAQRQWSWLRPPSPCGERVERRRQGEKPFADCTFLRPAAYIDDPDLCIEERNQGAALEKNVDYRSHQQPDSDLRQDPPPRPQQEPFIGRSGLAGTSFAGPPTFVPGELYPVGEPGAASGLQGQVGGQMHQQHTSDPQHIQFRQQQHIPIGQSEVGASMLHGYTAPSDPFSPLALEGMVAGELNHPVAVVSPFEGGQLQPAQGSGEMEKAAQSLFRALEGGSVLGPQDTTADAPTERQIDYLEPPAEGRNAGREPVWSSVADRAQTAGPTGKVVSGSNSISAGGAPFNEDVRGWNVGAGTRGIVAPGLQNPTGKPVCETYEEAEERKKQKRRADNIAAAKRSNAKRKAEYEELVRALALAKETASLLRRKEADLREENEELRASIDEAS